MRFTAAMAAFAALLCPLAAQRTVEADTAPIVRMPHDPNTPRAEDPLPGATGDQIRQADSKPFIPPFVTEIHTQADDPEGGAYGIWAAGKDYKVSFHDGATFVPYLGGDYPHNQPFRWSTTSVTVGNVELVTREEPLASEASSTRYEYDHGGVIEAYDVLLDGLEQTFVIHSAPGAGDLVVRGTVATALTASRVQGEHAGVQFVDHNGEVILTYGAATAIDASGRTAAMTTTFQGGQFELELDSAWLANATYPVTVDPLIGNVSLSTWGGSFGDPTHFDVLREDERATENVWVCYTRKVSATDSDMWVMRTDDNLPGSLFILAFRDITASWANGSCQLAHTPTRVICAFVRDFGSTRNIRWHAHHINDLSARIGYGAFGGSNNNWRVDIGGTSGTSPIQRAMVVFQHEIATTFVDGPDSQIRGFYIDMTGAATAGQGVAVNPVTILQGAMRDCERPQINQSAVRGIVPTHSWCVVHQHYDHSISNDDWDVYVDFWSETGGLQAFGLIEPNNGEHKLGPIVAGSDGRYLVSYAGQNSITGPVTTKAGRDLYSKRVDFYGTSVDFPHPNHHYLTSTGVVLDTGGISYDTNTKSHWLIAYRSGNHVTVDEYGFHGERLKQFTWIYGGGSATSGHNATCSFDADNNTYIIVGSSTLPANPVFGNIYYHHAVAPPSVSGSSCSTAGLSWGTNIPFIQFNPQRIGHEHTIVQLTGAPQSSLAIVGISLDTANISLSGIPGVGLGCSQLISTTTGFLGYLPVKLTDPLFGTAAWNLPLNENFWPLTFQMQAFHLDATSSEFLSTQRLSVPINY